MLRTQLKARLSVRPLVASVKRLNSSYTPEPEYTTEPKYPAIFDPSPAADERRKEEKWHDWLKSHSTVEEKLFEINMPKKYGWHCVMLKETYTPYNVLPMVKFITRTDMIEEETLTQMPGGQKIDELANHLLPSIKGHVEDTIVFQDESKSVGDRSSDQLLVSAINRILITNLVPSVPHLNDIELSHNPRLEAFWFVGGIDKAPVDELEFYFRQEFFKNHKPFTEDRAYQYVAEPILHVRSQQPLPEVVPRDTTINPGNKIEEFPYDPSTVFNYENKYRRAVTLPGFWPGDHYEFGLFSMHTRNHLDNRPTHYEPEEHSEAAHANAILASFSWAYGQACLQGFSTFHDVTYPLVTQTALTDGRRWSFYLYQLNTTLLHHENSTENKHYNVCWGTKTQDLFNSVENGRVIGFNEDVLKQILKMYLLAPQARPDVNLKPYLDKKHLVHQIEFDERREWLHNHFRHLMSNRRSTICKPEVTMTEKIFLTYYPSIRVKKPLTWFQLGNDPNDRRLDDHALKYRPKALRTNLKSKKHQRFYRNYYPGTNKEYDPDDWNS